MDKYVSSTYVPDFNSITGRTEIARNIWNAIKTSKGSTICVYGAQGCGKTYILQKILGDDYREYELERLEKTRSHSTLVVENPTNEIIEFLKVNGSFNSGTTVIVCDNIKKIDFCNCFEVSTFTLEEMNRLFPGYPEESRMSQGNMWNFEFYKQFKDRKDVFRTPKEYVQDILTTLQDSYISSSLEEHGHTVGMIHENFVDTRNLTIEECSEIMESLSIADIYDTMIYTVDWEYCQYFQVEGIARPATIIGGRYKKSTLRPGSCWTKANNQKMRMSKLKRFKPVCTEKLIMILDNLMKQGPQNNFYELTTQDVDVINHLKLSGKFKPSEVSRLKKSLSSYRATS